ncbi:hypothetical protein DMUE_4503 [Dictyocoela muelleri]|nr:hypothetical protein DMUE_4503 [Dictyocoela muelleri]
MILIPLIIRNLREKGLLNTYMYCSDCNNLLKKVKCKKNINGITFRCYKSICTNRGKYVSIRKNLFFFDLNKSLEDIYRCIFLWFDNRLQRDIIRDVGVSRSFF